MKVKGKRPRPEGGDGSTRSDEQLVGNHQTGGAARSIYVVVTTWEGTDSAFSVYKVDYPYPTPKKGGRLLHPVATLEIEGGKTFVSLQTRRRKWILAVGGSNATVVFDAETQEVVHAPSLLKVKDRPVVVALEDKVYALSRFPQVSGEQDFEPWFEVLDLSGARVVDGCLVDCSWKELPSPPCFPCYLSVHEFFNPPFVIVHSYAVAGSYILLSLLSNQQAIYAFDTISTKWHKVHGSKSLPFIGRSTLPAAGLYLGEPAQGNERWCSRAHEGDPAVISAYTIKLSHTCEKEDSIKLSITEFPIKSSETSNVVTGIHYSSLDKGIFCSLDWKSRTRVHRSVRRSWDDDFLGGEIHFSKKATITMRTYQMEDSSPLQGGEPVNKIAVSEQPQQSFKIRTESEGFVGPIFLAVFNT